MESETDTQYFGAEFTGESVELTPPDCGPLSLMHTIDEDQEDFTEFSYQNPNSILGGGSLHSINSVRSIKFDGQPG